MRKVSSIFITVLLLIVLLGIEIVIIRSATKYEPQVTVVYAGTVIPQGTEIKPDMLVEKRVILGAAHKKAVRNLEDAVGKRALVFIEEGEMLLSGKVGAEDQMEIIKVHDSGKHLFTVEFRNDQANGWWLLVGQNVDIIYVPNPRNPAGEAAGTGEGQLPGKAGLVFQDFSYQNIKRLSHVRIAAIIDEKGALLKNTGRAGLPKYISFEVDEEQDKFLAYAKGNGRLEISAAPTDEPGDR